MSLHWHKLPTLLLYLSDCNSSKPGSDFVVIVRKENSVECGKGCGIVSITRRCLCCGWLSPQTRPKWRYTVRFAVGNTVCAEKDHLRLHMYLTFDNSEWGWIQLFVYVNLCISVLVLLVFHTYARDWYNLGGKGRHIFSLLLWFSAIIRVF